MVDELAEMREDVIELFGHLEDEKLLRHEQQQVAVSAERGLTTFRCVPDGERRGRDRIGGQPSEMSGRDASFTHPQIDTGPRRSPSACSEVSKKTAADGETDRCPNVSR